MKKIIVLFISCLLLMGCIEVQKTEIIQSEDSEMSDITSNSNEENTELDEYTISEIEDFFKYWERLEGMNRFSYFEKGYSNTEKTEYVSTWIDLETYEYWEFWAHDPEDKIVYNYKNDISKYRGCEFDFENKETSGDCSTLTDEEFERLFMIKEECMDNIFGDFWNDFTVDDLCLYRPQ